MAASFLTSWNTREVQDGWWLYKKSGHRHMQRKDQHTGETAINKPTREASKNQSCSHFDIRHEDCVIAHLCYLSLLVCSILSGSCSKWIQQGCMPAKSCLTITLWTVASQAPLSMGFPRQESLNGLPFPSPGDLPDPRSEPMSLRSPALAGGFFNYCCHLGNQQRWLILNLGLDNSTSNNIKGKFSSISSLPGTSSLKSHELKTCKQFFFRFAKP